MLRILLLLLYGVCSTGAVAQEKLTDSIITVKDSITARRWEIGADMQSRYLWRGQSWGGNYPAFQPYCNFAATPALTVGVWATTNFNTQYYDPDGITPRGYQEFDFGLTYQLNSFLSFEIWDYYWPSLQLEEGVSRDYFNYGCDGVKTVDASVVADFSEGYQFAFDFTISTLIAGNDYRYSTSSEGPRQNYTTYVEAGYTFSDFLKRHQSKILQDIAIHPAIGVVLNNQAGYYTYADYDRPSLVNLAISVSRVIECSDAFGMQVSADYAHNASRNNTEQFGRNFVTAKISVFY